jgi:hypothetical protein
MSFGTKKFASAIADRDNMNPADWDCIGEYYVGGSEEIAECYGPTPDVLIGHDLGKCEHCGTFHSHGAGFKNRKTGEVLAVGRNCAEEFFFFTSTAARKVAQAAKIKARKEAAVEARAAAHNFLDANPGLAEAFETDHHIVADIKRQLLKKGHVSEKQVELVLKIAADVKRRAEEAANEPEPVAIPADLLEGRQRFEGVVLGSKWVANEWGGSLKLLVRDDRGFKLWGSAPDMAVEFRGLRVAFTARVAASDDDPTFGFYSRPTKWDVEEKAE